MTNLPDPAQALSPLKQAFLKLEQLQGKLDAAQRAKLEPLAVVGLGCRFPCADNPAAFWEFLRAGGDAVTEIPPERWNVDKYFDADPDAPGKIHVRWGAFLNNIDQFDAQFFGIAPREAESMDPQQRLLLEVTWEALEDAGQGPQRLAGSQTGVFVGMCKTDYALLQTVIDDPARYGMYHASGNAHSVAAGRISYLLGLNGPCVTVDTACSSGLAALHLACQSLRSSESRMAIVGGVNLALSPENTINYAKAAMLSGHGRCRSFDAGADGFVQGEGCGVVVLKRLSNAIADRDRVRAIIRGTAMNQDGASSGLTAPSGPAQIAVIRAALANGGVRPAEVGYVDAHGTGTTLGDPIEAQALGAALGDGRPADRPLLIGSVKANIGHLEAAAGLAGLIKLVLALEHQELPPHPLFNAPNPHIRWSELPLEVVKDLRPWPLVAGRRIAGVSSFGFSGTNVHVLVEAAPEPAPLVAETERPRQILTLSARSSAALVQLSARYDGALAADPAAVANIAFTANAGRAAWNHRLVATGADAAQLQQALQAYTAGQQHAALATSELDGADEPKLVLFFPGQGSQYPGMGRQLYQTQPTFRRAIDRCAELLRAEIDVPLLAILGYDGAPTSEVDVNQTLYTQTALFSIEFALAELWASWGVKPTAVLGHSVGEYVAASVAGVFSLEDGLKLIARRAKLMQSMAAGTMEVVFAPLAQVEQTIAPLAPRVSIAAINGPACIVISGSPTDVAAVSQQFAADGISTQRLTVSHAFHSVLVEPVLEEFRRAAAEVTFHRPRINLIANLTGERAGENIASADYWVRHAREPVQFEASCANLFKLGYLHFLECGPGTTLLGMARKCGGAEDGAWLPSLRKGRDEWESILQALGALYLAGTPIDWEGFDRDYPRRRVELPTYPFQRRRHWFAAQPRKSHAARRISGPSGVLDHPLIARRMTTALKQVVLESDLALADYPYLADHVVHGVALLPTTAYLELATAAARDYLGAEAVAIDDFSIDQPVTLPADGVRTLQLILTPREDGAAEFQFFTRANEAGRDWTLHAAGALRLAANTHESNGAGPYDRAAIEAHCQTDVDTELLYQGLWQRGLHFGPAFRAVKRLRRTDGEAFGEIQLPADSAAEASGYHLHPALLDGCVQVMAAALPGFVAGDGQADIYMPLCIERCEFFTRAAGRLVSYARVEPADTAKSEILVASIEVYDAAGTLVCRLRRMQLKRATSGMLRRRPPGNLDQWFYEVEWREAPLPAVVTGHANLQLASPLDVAARLAPRYRALEAAHWSQLRDQLMPEHDALCRAYIETALSQLGWRPRLGDRFTTHALAAELQVASQHEALLGRLLAILAEDGVLRRADGAWEVIASNPVQSPEWRQLAQRFPTAAGELTFLANTAEHLGDALAGRRDPLELLFANGSFELADGLYRETPAAKVFHQLAQEALLTATRSLPPGRKLRVLEIGAGTGGTTSYLLPQLPADRTHYVYTDISPAFLAKAGRDFARHEFVEYRLLNIEQPPTEQGFVAGAFDVVIASNVLHATADLRQTLRHATSLLAGDGLLLIIEETRPQRGHDITFGLTLGWWRFQDRDLRPDYPLLSRGRWVALLSELGLRDVVSLPAANDPSWPEHSLLLAKKPPTAASAAPVNAATAAKWLIFADRGGALDQVAKKLAQRGTPAILVNAGADYAAIAPDRFQINPANPLDYRRLLDATFADGAKCAGVIHGWALDAAIEPLALENELEAALACGVRSVLHAVQAIAGGDSPLATRLWLLSRGAQAVTDGDSLDGVAAAPLWGLAKAIAWEHPELQCVRIDLDNRPASAACAAVLAELDRGDGEPQVAYRGEARYVARLTRAAATEPVKANCDAALVRWEIASPGVIDGLATQPIERRAPGSGEVTIRVRATGLNFRDVLNLLATRSDNDPLGSECAGRIEAVGAGVDGLREGDEVVAIASGSLGTIVTTAAQLVLPKPAGLSFDQAAALPLAYLTAQFALVDIGKLARGERILIHAAAGGVGMAAVQIARAIGAEIFATAGSPEKRAALSALGIEHVMDSRSLNFADEIRTITGGAGIDVVLNSSTGETIPASLRLLRSEGRFLEIGKSEIWNRERVAAVNPHAVYTAIDLSIEISERPASVRRCLEQIFSDIEQGRLAPLPVCDFPFDQAIGAFRLLARARHIGKVVISQRDAAVGASQPISFRPDGSYLITGGLAGLGLRVAEWMSERGAGALVLMGRSAASPAAREAIAAIEARGTRVLIVQGDVARAGDVAVALEQAAQDLPPLRGVIHSAGVLDDGVLVDQSWERFAGVLAPKVQGAWHLHRETSHLQLDHFVLFSSISSLLGASGQGNHAAANAFLDALAHHRRASGRPALSINWGAWAQIGSVTRRGADEHIGRKGLTAFSPDEGLAALERLMGSPAAQMAVLAIDWDQFRQRSSNAAELRFLAEIAVKAKPTGAGPARAAAAPAILPQLEQASPKKRFDLLESHVRDQVARILGLGKEQSFGDRQPLQELGLDSLMAVELRNVLRTSLGLPRPLIATLAFDYPTVAALTNYLSADVLGWEQPKQAKPESRPTKIEVGSALDALDELSDEDVDRMLSQRMAREELS